MRSYWTFTFVILFFAGSAQTFTKTYKLNSHNNSSVISSTVESAEAVHPLSDGGFLIAGNLPQVNAVGFYPYLLKIDAQGDSLWSKTYDYWPSGRVFDFYKDPQGNMQLAVSVSKPGLIEEGVLLQLDTTNGDTLSSKALAKHSQCMQGGTFHNLLHLADGSMIISYRDDAAGTGSQDDNGHLYKINPAGNPTWEFGNDGTNNSYQILYDLILDGDKIVGTGQEINASNNYIGEWVTTMVDTAGNLQWSTTLQAPNTGWGYRWTTLGLAVTRDPGGNYLVGGGFKFDNRLLPLEGTVVRLSNTGDSLNHTRILHSKEVSDFYLTNGTQANSKVMAAGTGYYVDSSGASEEYYEKAMLAEINPVSSGKMLAGVAMAGDTNAFPGLVTPGKAIYRGNALAPAGNGAFLIVGSGFRNSEERNQKLTFVARMKSPGLSTPEFPSAKLNFEVYPNPARDFLFVKSSQNESQQLRVINSQGRILLKLELNSAPYRLDVSALPAGLYILSLGNTGLSRKVLVESR